MSGSGVRRAIRPRPGLAGPLRLAGRLAARDLRHRPGTGLLLLVALLAATTTMTLALVVRDSAQAPWDATFAATAGPHLVAITFDADEATDRAMAGLAATPEIVAHAGPYPLLAIPTPSTPTAWSGPPAPTPTGSPRPRPATAGCSCCAWPTPTARRRSPPPDGWPPRPGAPRC